VNQKSRNWFARFEDVGSQT